MGNAECDLMERIDQTLSELKRHLDRELVHLEIEQGVMLRAQARCDSTQVGIDRLQARIKEMEGYKLKAVRLAEWAAGQ